MAKKRILWQLFPTYLLITFAAIFAVGWFSLDSLRDFYYDRTAEDLKNRAWLVEHQVVKASPTLDSDILTQLSKELGDKTDTRITIINLSGKVLGDSHEDPLRMNNHSDRPEFQTAMQKELGMSIRFSDTLEERMMYLAVPLIYQNKKIGVVRTSIPVTFIDHALRAIEVKIDRKSVV